MVFSYFKSGKQAGAKPIKPLVIFLINQINRVLLHSKFWLGIWGINSPSFGEEYLWAWSGLLYCFWAILLLVVPQRKSKLGNSVYLEALKKNQEFNFYWKAPNLLGSKSLFYFRYFNQIFLFNKK